MSEPDLTTIPEAFLPRAQVALRDAFGDGVNLVTPVIGGASGALTYRVESNYGSHLLRIEALGNPGRNPHQYTHMEAAAAAGIAPPLRYLNAEDGVVVMPFITTRPIGDYPGGPAAAAAAAAVLVRRLHSVEPTFNEHGDRLDNLRRLLRFLETSGKVSPGLLGAHRAGFDAIVAAYPWDTANHVSAHNDPNAQNLLFDGGRLWLIDWETSSRNDPFIDIATLIAHLGHTPELRDTVMRSALGRAPDEVDRARVALAGQLVRLFAGCILLLVVNDPSAPVHTDLAALTTAEFQQKVATGELVPSQPATAIAFAKLMLDHFVEGLRTPAFAEAIATLA